MDPVTSLQACRDLLEAERNAIWDDLKVGRDGQLGGDAACLTPLSSSRMQVEFQQPTPSPCPCAVVGPAH